jgi:hypothetical protein
LCRGVTVDSKTECLRNAGEEGGVGEEGEEEGERKEKNMDWEMKVKEHRKESHSWLQPKARR